MIIVSATANLGKFTEIKEILSSSVELLARPKNIPDVVEDADDLVGNARLKANAIMKATGLAAVADDTGLEVDALNGGPGVHSARYAGEYATDQENVTKLLKDLIPIPTEGRTARFRTVVLVAWPDGNELVAHGVAEGRITQAPVGKLGFGYDAVFLPDEGEGKTFGEMENEEKNQISHRGKALRALNEKLSITFNDSE